MTPPSGCRWCGVEAGEHYQRWTSPTGWHVWAQPTDEQIKQRMRARREKKRERHL